MKIVCITKTDGLTVGKQYDVLSIEPNPNSKWKTEGFVIINDDGFKVWHEECPMGIIEVLPMTGEVIEYIGNSSDGLTQGKYYDVLNRDSRESQSGSYYFMDDNNKFVGISKRNYFGGAHNFNKVPETVVQKIKFREITLKNISL